MYSQLTYAHVLQDTFFFLSGYFSLFAHSGIVGDTKYWLLGDLWRTSQVYIYIINIISDSDVFCLWGDKKKLTPQRCVYFYSDTLYGFIFLDLGWMAAIARVITHI